jgi:excinuclease UvrABC ATPase subunit
VYKLLQQLRDAGHTIIASEHHPVFTQLADYSIILGPGAGPDGGKIAYAGITGHFSASL